jgi:hypothetical protein
MTLYYAGLSRTEPSWYHELRSQFAPGQDALTSNFCNTALIGQLDQG